MDKVIHSKAKKSDEPAWKHDAHGILVLKSKLHKPAIRKEFVRLQALIDYLEEKIAKPLTLISTPTGCGQSVSASQWLVEANFKYGWLTLDEEHNDIQVFLVYIAALLKEQWPHKRFGLKSLLRTANLPSRLIASTFLNDLDQLEELFVLVLDDYQVIRNEKIHELIKAIILDTSEKFHLVILTQRDPPLQFPRMRALFQLNELRMVDLAFTNDEAVQLRA